VNRIRRAFLSTLAAIVGVAAIGIAPATAGTSTPNQIFVQRSYFDLLDRSAESPAFETWVSELDGGLPRPEYAFALLRSTEFREIIVEAFYNQYLERSADPAGLAGFAPLIDGENSWEHVQSLLLGSDEFFAIAGDDNANFVTGLYFLLLDRAPDKAGHESFLQKLNEGWSRQMVAEAVALSPEARSILIDDFYSSLLGRSVDDAALEVWVVTPYETVLIAIIGSDEYFNLPVKP
jgi:hypothetical protein